MHPFPSFTSALLLTSIASTCLAGVIPPVSTPLEPVALDLRSSLPPGPSVRIPLEDEVPRLIIYFQTTHNWINKEKNTGEPISMLPLIVHQRIALTHLIVCSFHVNANNTIYLNDFPPEHPLFWTLWNETEVMKTAGVKVMGMVGGAAWGSFEEDTLDAPPGSILFEQSYALLANAIRRYRLQGMDLDVEQPMSQYGISRLIRRLRADFGPDFIITLSPVARALLIGSSNLSGFSYFLLEQSDGKDIDFYMAQFYNGWGSLLDPTQYSAMIDNYDWDPRRIVAGQVTTRKNGFSWVPFDTLKVTIQALQARYGQIGGIMGWEYFNGEPGGEAEPWRWAQEMTAILRPGLWSNVVLTKDMAAGLVKAWRDSVVGSQSVFVNSNLGNGEATAAAGNIDESLLMPNVDYMAMVNA
ncbi:Glycoside hydrolase superfamily [Rhypophila decipiens]